MHTRTHVHIYSHHCTSWNTVDAQTGRFVSVCVQVDVSIPGGDHRNENGDGDQRVRNASCDVEPSDAICDVDSGDASRDVASGDASRDVASGDASRDVASGDASRDVASGDATRDVDARSIGSDDESPLSMPHSPLRRGLWFVSLPLVVCFVFTIPDVRRGGCWRRLYMVTLCASVIWIAGLTYVLVWMVTVVGQYVVRTS